ncbi:MAG: thiamine-phosphate kinase [Candidatus Bathyarchaeia archaeon]
MHTAEQLGERKIIETILRHFTKAPNMGVPFGDDVSAIRHEDGDLAILKTDMLVGKTDVPPQMNLQQAARKAVVMNISDFAAKGVKPRGLVVALGIQPDRTEKEIQQIAEGLNAGAREYDTYVLGGDTTETDDLIISVALYGSANIKKLMLRSGARPGDIVATTGCFGLTASGLRMLTEEATAPPEAGGVLADAVLMPRARLREGLSLARTGVVRGSIDSSDGLAWSLHEISRASNVGFVIDEPPIAREAYQFAEINRLDPVELALYGGEEYELVVTVEPQGWRKAQEAVKQEGGCLIPIGETTAKKGIFLEQKGRRVKVEARGYEHFRHERRKKDG